MWFVVRVNFDQNGKQSNSIQTFQSEEAAYIRDGADRPGGRYRIASQVFRHSSPAEG